MNIDYLMTGDEITKFLSENLKAKISILNSILNSDDSKTHFSSRIDHGDWFRGLDTTYTSKVSSNKNFQLATIVILLY